MRIKMNDVIYWVRSTGPGGKDRVPMYYKGRWARDCEDGLKGDVKARPTHLGDGPFTATYAPSDFETEEGSPVFGS